MIQNTVSLEPVKSFFEVEPDLLSSVLNSLEQAVALMEPDGKVVLSNLAFRRMFAFPGDLLKVTGTLQRDLGLASRLVDLRSAAGRSITVRLEALDDRFLVVAADVTTDKDERDLLEAAARTDPLTSLGNRKQLVADAERWLGTPRRPGEVAFFAVDLDRFKAVNDTLGHPIGDALLIAVAGRLRSLESDRLAVYRLGGDEFGVLFLSDGPADNIAHLARRIVDLLGRTYIVEGQLLNVSASVGVALVSTTGVDREELLRCADLALYEAKRAGRNVYTFFHPEMDRQMQNRRSLELDLRRAQALREFALVYQPQLNLSSGRVTGFEALLRWHSPTRGLVSPADFIPLAEELKLIVPIGRWVLETACKEAASWSEDLSIAVNVSAIQFDEPTFAGQVESALRDSGLTPGRLELEITESVLLGDKNKALKTLHAVRALGVRISMDDFGTGYSSLSYLRSFPFDKIKIDQSFVRENADNPGCLAIVKAIASLGKSLGMTTTAEGVETDEQMSRVTADGCTDVQGYLVSRPMPPAQIETYLASRRTPSEDTKTAGENDASV
jgi:diguanylate cyclase (GGDEF)-like protein